ncbi:MAG: hypothetical protein EOM15_13765, partial [Spirochaetia bacterium]|nr:hypothetical protein [Spirochaetia bacterium]
MKHLISIILLTIGLIISCNLNDETIYNVFDQVDCTPPILTNIETLDSQTVLFTFNEIIDHQTVSLTCCGNSVRTKMVHNQQLTISLNKPIALAQSQAIEGSVCDIRGNSTYFSISAWAKNEQIPTLLINEFTTKGNETHPDRVELIATSRGNIAGMTLYAGTKDTWTDRIILPDRWVERGTYLVVSFTEGAVHEDLHCSELLTGLGSNNGCLTLAKTPHWNSTILDAVVWGNHSTSTYDGFGSKALKDAVQFLYNQGHWRSNSCNESVDSTNSTATRSICRDSLRDTNSSTDWYICATKAATFGSANCA